MNTPTLLLLLTIALPASPAPALLQETDTLSANELLNKGNGWYRKDDYDSAVFYYRLAIKKGLASGNLTTVAKSHNNAGVCYYQSGDLKAAVTEYEEALRLYREIGNTERLIQTILNQALFYKRENLYDKAIELLQETDRLARAADMPKVVAEAVDALGNIHRELNNKDIALTYLEEAKSIREQLNLNKATGRSFQNLGIYYLQYEVYDSAEIYLNAAYTILEDIDRKNALSVVSKLGDLALQNAQPLKALSYYEQAYQGRKAPQIPFGIAGSANKLAEVHMQLGNLQQSLQYLQEAEQLIDRDQYPNLLSANYSLHKILAEKQKDYRKALFYADKLLRNREKILDEERIASLVRAEIAYDVEKKKTALAQQQTLLQKNRELLEEEKKVKLAYLIGLLIFVALAIALYQLFKAEKKLSLRRKFEKEQKEKHFKELQHRTQNNLQLQHALVGLQETYTDRTDEKNLLREIRSRMEAIILINKSLHIDEENEQTEKLDLKDYLTRLTENLMISFNYNRNNIDLETAFDEVSISVEDAINIGLFVNEAVTNAFKYAFSEGGQNSLLIRSLYRDEMLVITVRDNGPGIEKSKAADKTSYGLSIMEDLSNQLNGTLRISNKSGTEVTLTIPQPKKRLPH